MEMQLQELIDQIKKDGVKAADVQAAEILEAANAKAREIVAEAAARAEKMVADAKLETERMTQVSEDAIRQAGRNLLITFRDSIQKELDAVVGEQVSAVYEEGTLTELIAQAVEARMKDTAKGDLQVLVSREQLDALEEGVLAALKQRMLCGVTLSAGQGVKQGFRIAVDGGRAYYDYAPEAMVEMLSAYLSPKVGALMKEAVKE